MTRLFRFWKEESREGATTPLAKASARWGASPMSTEKHAWAEDERGDTLAPLEDGKGDGWWLVAKWICFALFRLC